MQKVQKNACIYIINNVECKTYLEKEAQKASDYGVWNAIKKNLKNFKFTLAFTFEIV